MSDIIEPRRIEANFITDAVYHEYTCSECGALAKNTYCEPICTNMLDRLLCWDCNYWRDIDVEIAADHKKMTIINGHIYSPGSRTSGSFLGMAGRRFDIEYIEPSIYAGKRVTTFDLWSGSTMPDKLKEKYPDTAIFLGGAKRCKVGETTCWNSSERKDDPYPLPKTLGIK